MPSLFNIIRLGIYLTVIVFSLICLALAANFQHVLATSDLTRFVPFSIFVSVMSLVVISTLLAFSSIKGARNPISTRLELACLAFAGVLWLILGVFLGTSESGDAEVECFSELTDTIPLDDSDASFHTSAYLAMYHVLMAFAILNAILLLASFATLLTLALKRYYSGDEQMWYGPVTSCPWLARYSKESGPILPGPRGNRSATATAAAAAVPAAATATTRKPKPAVPTEKRWSTRAAVAAMFTDKAPQFTEKPTRRRDRDGNVQREWSGSSRRPLNTPIADAHARHGSGRSRGNEDVQRSNSRGQPRTGNSGRDRTRGATRGNTSDPYRRDASPRRRT